MLWTIRRIFFGPLSPTYVGLGDAHGIELVPLVTLAALILVFGMVPSLLTEVIEPGIIPLANRLGAQ